MADYDPCALASDLRTALHKLIKGQGESEVRFADRSVRYHAASINELRAELRKYEGECAALRGDTGGGRRYAIKAGTRRRML